MTTQIGYNGTIVNNKDTFQAVKKMRVSIESRDKEIAELRELIELKDKRIANLEAEVFELREQVKKYRGKAMVERSKVHELKQSLVLNESA